MKPNSFHEPLSSNLTSLISPSDREVAPAHIAPVGEVDLDTALAGPGLRRKAGDVGALVRLAQLGGGCRRSTPRCPRPALWSFSRHRRLDTNMCVRS